MTLFQNRSTTANSTNPYSAMSRDGNPATRPILQPGGYLTNGTQSPAPTRKRQTGWLMALVGGHWENCTCPTR